MKISTTCVHAGHKPDDATGSVNIPIYATSTYAYRRFGEHRGWEYSRTGNPTRSALERAVAELEGGADGIAFASGLAAVDAITDLLEPGDQIVAADNLYGGTYRLFSTITERHGVEVSFVNVVDSSAFAKSSPIICGTICHERPKRSTNQPHWTASPPSVSRSQ